MWRGNEGADTQPRALAMFLTLRVRMNESSMAPKNTKRYDVVIALPYSLLEYLNQTISVSP
jgi:hypothetical protein